MVRDHQLSSTVSTRPSACQPGPRGTDARPTTCHGGCRHGLITALVSRLSFTRSGEGPRASSSEWSWRSVERTAAREPARNAAVGGKCGKRRCLLDHAGSCFRIRTPPFPGFFTRDRGTRRHAACPVVHAVRRRDCRSPRCPEAGAGLHDGSGAWPAGRAGHAEGRPVGGRSLLRLAGGRRRGMAASGGCIRWSARTAVAPQPTPRLAQ
jgi:hypothetical protein